MFLEKIYYKVLKHFQISKILKQKLIQESGEENESKEKNKAATNDTEGTTQDAISTTTKSVGMRGIDIITTKSQTESSTESISTTTDNESTTENTVESTTEDDGNREANEVDNTTEDSTKTTENEENTTTTDSEGIDGKDATSTAGKFSTDNINGIK